MLEELMNMNIDILFKVFCYSMIITGVLALVCFAIIIPFKLFFTALFGVTMIFLIAGVILFIAYQLAIRTGGDKK